MSDIKGVIKKTVDLNAIGIMPNELTTKNITEIPIERMYYFCNCTKQLVIHKINSRYYIYTMNWLPKFHTENHVYEYQPNHWQRIVSYSKIDDAIRIFRKYVKEIIGEDTKKITLEDCIKYLTELKAITENYK